MPAVALIWAMSENHVIGRGNSLPWRLPTDMRFFMRQTLGKPVVMGRKTFESMPAPLPGRTNIVVTSQQNYARPGIQVVSSFSDAVTLGEHQCLIDGQDEIMVAGGAAIYAEGLSVADRLYVTQVKATLEGDTYFPPIDWDQWRCLWSKPHPADERNSYAFKIECWERSTGISPPSTRSV